MEKPFNTATNNSLHCPAGLLLPFVDESGWNPSFRGILYFFALIYSFVGVSVVTDIFMSAVITITSQTKKVYLAKERLNEFDDMGTSFSLNKNDLDFIEVRVWNETVASLTLMALGTSAPEILLACIEIVKLGFETGEFGPGTIIGSAAFNLFVISAICLVSVPAGERRQIRSFTAFLVCAFFSIFAYLWLWAILSFSSPNEVELWEAGVTLLMFPGVVLFAYGTDKRWGCKRQNPHKMKRQINIKKVRDEHERMLAERNFFKNGKLDKESLVTFIRELKKIPGVSYEDAAVLAASKVYDSTSKSALHYRLSAVRSLTAGKKVQPQIPEKLQGVYEAINESKNIGTLRNITPDTHAIVEFHAATCAVVENIQNFYVTVWRHGNLKQVAKVRVQSVDGSAKANEDYVKIDQVLMFEQNQTEKLILVEIIDNKQWEPDEEFFLKLSVVDTKMKDNRVRLGRANVMEILIINDYRPGVVSFERKGLLVKESAESAIINVCRKHSAGSEVSVKWRTIDGTAVSGKHYFGGQGQLDFKNSEILKTLDIPIINPTRSIKDASFEVVLYGPKNVTVGQINRICVTITSDEAFANFIDKVLRKITSKIDSIVVFRKTWPAQIKDAMNVKGGDLDNATGSDYILHFISFNWKFLFSFIPPPSLLGGWVCFFISLAGIGFVTAIIGDIAVIFGCVVGLKDTTAAITLVAMGTSLPDVFSSRIAALKEEYADAAIGNIMGSNCVNVFLGLGLPWFIASSYHTAKGKKFTVPAGTLAFNVLLFSLSALTATGILVMRRKLAAAGNAELGGPTGVKIICFFILLGLYFNYILLSTLQDYGYISVNF